MSEQIKIPDIGDADDVEVVEILASAGDEVGEDDPLIVIESDKASMEVPAGVAGKLDSIEVAIGDKVQQGQVIASITRSGGETSSAKQADDKPSSADRQQPDAEQAPEPQESRKVSRGDGPQDDRNDDGNTAGNAAGGEPQTVEVRVPDIGEAENVEVIEVAVKAGDQVDEDDLLVVVESDKASMEIPSTRAGKVVQVHVSEGSAVEQGTLLVTLEAVGASATEGRTEQVPRAKETRTAEKTGKGEEAEKAERAEKAEKTEKTEKAEKTAVTEQPEPEEAAEEPASRRPEPSGDAAGADIYAGPAVRRLARELGVELRGVRGSGNRGRIVKDDVKAHVKSRLQDGGEGRGGGGLPALPEIDFSKFGEVETQALSRIRARGAENLHRAWLNVPHVTQHDEVDVTDLEDFRAGLKKEGEARGVKVTPLAFIIKACCHVLKEFPTFNASLDRDAKHFVLKRYYHIGMAVDTPEGLVVPVIRDADRKGIWELSAEIVALADKARNRKLGVADLQGGSFSVSSLGPIGGTGFTPIINAPEVAILGVSRVTMRPHWTGKEFVPRQMLPLSLSYDHRAINGAEAGRFVARLGELLADIRRLAL